MRRFARNVGILAIATTIHLVVVTITSGAPQVMYRLSMSTGYASVALMAWAMAIGPWRLRGGRVPPVSTDLRRDVGIWAGILAIAHVVTGLQVHMAGKFWKYFVYPDGDHIVPLRYDLFGFANWTGLAATLVLIMLLAISNDASLRALGTRRWKTWQQWTYWAAALVVAHTIAYQVIERDHGWWMLAFVLVAAVVLGLQLDGRRRFRERATPS